MHNCILCPCLSKEKKLIPPWSKSRESSEKIVRTQVNCGLWVAVMCQRGVTNCNKCTTLGRGGMLIMEAYEHGCPQGVDRKSLYLLLNFTVNLKLL